MTLMRSPDGDEMEIVPAGVASLSHLGWEVVDDGRKQPEPAKKSAPRGPKK